MTNDGELGNAILHPRYEVKKTYEAWVAGFPSAQQLERLEQGIEIEGITTQPPRYTCSNEARIKVWWK